MHVVEVDAGYFPSLAHYCLRFTVYGLIIGSINGYPNGFRIEINKLGSKMRQHNPNAESPSTRLFVCNGLRVLPSFNSIPILQGNPHSHLSSLHNLSVYL